MAGSCHHTSVVAFLVAVVAHVAAHAGTSQAESADEVHHLPGFGRPRNRMLSGFINANASSGAYIYYVLFESQKENQNAKTPIVFWINGGPGASSALGNYLGHGPYRVQSDGPELKENLHAWNQLAHVAYVDQPAGTGYSYGPPPSSYDQVASEFAGFLTGLFERHPRFAEAPIFLAGESFAGTFLSRISAHILTQVPALAHRLHGLALGNPGILHYEQYRGQIPYAKALALIGEKDAVHAEKVFAECRMLMDAGKPIQAFTRCEAMSSFIMEKAGNPFQYDIRKWGDVFGTTLAPALARYLNSSEVKEALHVTGQEWKNGDGTSAPNPVVNALRPYLMSSSTTELGTVLTHGVPVVIYEGVFDGSVCNHISVLGAVLDHVENWDGKAAFQAARREIWQGEDHPLGYWQSGGGLNFVWISNSGHLVPLDQPVASLRLLQRFLDIGLSSARAKSVASLPESDVAHVLMM